MKACEICGSEIKRKPGDRSGKHAQRRFCGLPCSAMHASRSRASVVEKLPLRSGQTFGAWTVVGPVARAINGSGRWAVKCECGTEATRHDYDVYRLTHCGCRNQAPGGEAHYAWKGAGANAVTKRQRLNKRIKASDHVCELCKCKKAGDIFRRDGNLDNADATNIGFACRPCSMRRDGRMEKLNTLERKASYAECKVCKKTSRSSRMLWGRCHTCSEYYRRTGIERPEKPNRQNRLPSTPGIDLGYRAKVREMRCLVHNSECSGQKHAHHAGERPGMSLKASDYTCISLCHVHHSQLHAMSGYFKGWTKEALRVWQDQMIAYTVLRLAK